MKQYSIEEVSRAGKAIERRIAPLDEDWVSIPQYLRVALIQIQCYLSRATAILSAIHQATSSPIGLEYFLDTQRYSERYPDAR